MMNMRHLSIILTVSLFLCALAPVNAQEHKRVEVTKNYTHEVSPAKKIIAPTEINDTQDIDPTITYDVSPETWQIELEDHNFKPARANYWDYNRAEHFFAELATGYPLVSDATLRYTTYNTRVGYFGVGIEHDGNFAKKIGGDGLKRSMADSYAISNRVNVGGGVIAGRQIFEARADYDYSLLNRYAELNPSKRLNFHDANLVLRYGDDFADLSRLNFAIEARGGYWGHVVPPIACDIMSTSEIRAGIVGDVARDFTGNVVGLRAGFDMWKGDALTGYKNLSFNVAARYARDFGIVDVQAELKYMYDKVSHRAKASHFIMPSARVSIDLGKVGIMPFVEINTDVKQNSIEAIYDANPYIAFYPMQYEFAKMAPTLNYNVHVGISGTDRGSKLAYRVYLGADFMRDKLFWYVNEVGTFGFAQDNNSRPYVGAEVEYHPVGGLTIAASARAHFDDTSSIYAVSDPAVVADVKVEYALKRWNFSLSGDFTGKRRWSYMANEMGEVAMALEAPAVFDLEAGIGFRATDAVEVYAKGYNLLNQKIYDYAYYYRNGIGFMVGAKIDF